MGEDVAAVGDLEREVDVLLDEEHAAPALLCELADDGQELLDDQRREPEAELVEEQQLRPARERARDREHLLLAAREEPDAPPLELLQLREVLVRERDVELLAAVGDAEVLGNGHAEEEAAPFRHVRDAEPRAGARRDPREVGALEADAIRPSA